MLARRPRPGTAHGPPAPERGGRRVARGLIAGIPLVLALAITGCRRCSDPELVPYETPAQAVYRLAGELGARGEREAQRMALEHIIARYPSSRFAVMARDDLERMAR